MNTMIRQLEINSHFRPVPDTPTNPTWHLQHLKPLIDKLGLLDPSLGRWYLKGDSLEEATLYNVYDTNGVTTAASVVLEQQRKALPDNAPGVLGLWNGEEKDKAGAIDYAYSTSRFPNSLNIAIREVDAKSRLGGVQQFAQLIEIIVKQWKPRYVNVVPTGYKKVFPDKLGVGAMLYIPTSIEAELLPEARQLIPVHIDKQRVGTIIVSIHDEPFDVQNDDHVEVANEIEIRLAENDFLPRYIDL